jgi:hypothetical protein
MDIKGTITRLIPGTRKDKSDERVFIRPEDPSVLRKLDGEQYVASGEIPHFQSIDGLEVGDEITIEVNQ